MNTLEHMEVSLPIPRSTRLSKIRDGEEAPIYPHKRPQIFMIMKATRLCNLRCSYCNAWKEGPNQIMSHEVMRKATEQAFQIPWAQRVDFVWHGGETTLLPIAYFEAAMEVQRQCQGDRLVANSIQTNATLLDDRWIRLFKEGHFSVGISMDLPPEMHARYRRTKGGKSSWQATLNGVRLVKEAGIPHGILIVVTPALIEYGAARVLACLHEHHLTSVALLNVVPDNRVPAEGSENYLDWDRYVRFLTEIYIEREKQYPGLLKVRELDDLVAGIRGGAPKTCVYVGNCMGQYLTIEPSGDVSACDKYIHDPQYSFGNLMVQDINAILSDVALRSVRREHLQSVSRLQECRYFNFCQGSCPHDQYLKRKILPERSNECCGLSPLIEAIQERQSSKRELY